MTAIPETIEKMMSDPDLIIGLATQLKQERESKILLEQQNHLQTEQLKIQAPKTKYYDEVLQSHSTYNTTQIAKELGMSAEKLNKKLKELGVQYRQRDQWLLMQKYSDK